MDPKLLKGVAVLIAIGLHLAASSVPPDWQGYLLELAGIIGGWAALRRPGDLGPLTGRRD